MKTNNKHIRQNKIILAILMGSIAVVIISTITGFFLVRKYIIQQAETRIQDVLQEAEALHYYVQREMHPAMYQLKKENRMPAGFYSPEILSSSYITRRVFKQYNSIRENNKQLKVEYRMAAKNPRNSVNQANSFETELIDLFSKDSSIQKYSGIINEHGEKHLVYARPFLRVEEKCLICHGNKNSAPKELKDYYHWSGGFNLKVGDITAIEVIKTPLKGELNTLMAIGVIILIVSFLLVVLIIMYSNLILRNSLIKEQNLNIENNLNKIKETQNQLVHAEKMASLGVLTAGVSHEINNPLNFIQGAYYGLQNYFNKKKPEFKGEVSVLLDGLDTGLERAKAIVQSLNHFSRDCSNYNEDCNLHVIIDNCLLILKNQLKNRIEIDTQYTSESVIIKGNEGKLHQVFINILTNAIQSIETNGKIIIKSLRSKNDLAVLVKDTGCGIDEKNLNKIMEPFFTTKDPGKGTGLGLSITYSILKDHNAELQVNSTPGLGTEVKIIFKNQ